MPKRLLYLSMKVRPGSSFTTSMGREFVRDFGVRGCVGVVMAFDSEEAALAFDPEAAIDTVKITVKEAPDA